MKQLTAEQRLTLKIAICCCLAEGLYVSGYEQAFVADIGKDEEKP